MVTVQGTNRIKGVLDLGSIKQQLVKGQTLHLKDDDFWKPDVQTAIKMGWIKTKASPSGPEEVKANVPLGSRYIKCINNHHRSIGLSGKDQEIRPGQVFTLKESEMDSVPIRSAISKGIIKPLGVANPAQDTAEAGSEGRIHVSKRMQELEGVELPGESEPAPEVIETEDVETAAGEGVVKLDFDTNEEVSSDVVEDNKGVVWNKVGIDTPSEVIEDDQIKEVDPNADDPRRHSIVVDPHKARLNAFAANQPAEITFVDKNEDLERRASHPKLKDQPLPDEDEGLVVISDIDDDEARIAAHPILSKQPRDDGVDFIDDLDTIERIQKHPVLSKQQTEE